MNLTALTGNQAIIEKHFLDSLMGAGVIETGKELRVFDIGTGAGFPSIPLKIQRPEISVTLVDSSRKKTAFLLNLCGNLGLKTVRVLTERVETLHHSPDHQSHYDWVVARAFAKPALTFRTAVPFRAPTGRILLYLSPSGAEELGPPDGWASSRIDYALPFSESKRSLVLLSRSE